MIPRPGQDPNSPEFRRTLDNWKTSNNIVDEEPVWNGRTRGPESVRWLNWSQKVQEQTGVRPPSPSQSIGLKPGFIAPKPVSPGTVGSSAATSGATSSQTSAAALGQTPASSPLSDSMNSLSGSKPANSTGASIVQNDEEEDEEEENLLNTPLSKSRSNLMKGTV